MSQDSDNNNTMHTTNHHQRTGPTGAPGPAGPLVDEPHSPMRAPLRNTPVHDMPTPLHPQQHARRASTQYQQQQPQPQQQQQQSVETTETQYHNATSGKPSNTTGRVPSTKTAGGIPSNRIPSTTITTGGIPAANTGQQQAASSAAAPGVSSAMSSTSGAVPPTGASGIGGAAVGGGTGGTSGIGIAGSPGVAVTGVASCMWHPSDAVVRPIVANSRIERPVTPSWEAAALPCAALVRGWVMRVLGGGYALPCAALVCVIGCEGCGVCTVICVSIYTLTHIYMLTHICLPHTYTHSHIYINTHIHRHVGSWLHWSAGS